jgi:hypothetical protein
MSTIFQSDPNAPEHSLCYEMIGQKFDKMTFESKFKPIFSATESVAEIEE